MFRRLWLNQVTTVPCNRFQAVKPTDDESRKYNDAPPIINCPHVGKVKLLLKTIIVNAVALYGQLTNDAASVAFRHT